MKGPGTDSVVLMSPKAGEQRIVITPLCVEDKTVDRMNCEWLRGKSVKPSSQLTLQQCLKGNRE